MRKSKSKPQVTLIVGARPNFIKAAPLLQAMKKEKFSTKLIHTGQHFDSAMSDIFFEQLRLPKPDLHLDIKKKSPSQQIAEIILALEKEFLDDRPNLVIVFGDVNSTLAAAILANKMEIPLAHVEAGLRSFDRTMPEEHNRVVTDMLADILFTPSPDADGNLISEGISVERIHRVGNIMVDSLILFREKAARLNCWHDFNVQEGAYVLVTLHRSSNVDVPATLQEIFSALEQISKHAPIIFPVHPRTRTAIKKLGITKRLNASNMMLVPPLNYLHFLNLMMHARVVLTDSGGIQEETTVLGVPCLTLRKNTERPITIIEGTNRLVGTATADIVRGFNNVLSAQTNDRRAIELWDGRTSDRIVKILSEIGID